MSALVQLNVDVRFRLVWCRGCLACICCKVVRSLETIKGQGVGNLLNRVKKLSWDSQGGAIYKLSCAASKVLFDTGTTAEENHREGLYPPCRCGDRHEAGLELAVEPFDKSIGCGVVSCGTYSCGAKEARVAATGQIRIGCHGRW